MAMTVPIHPLFGCRETAKPTSAKQLTVTEIGMRLARELNQQWHSMLPRTDLGNLLCGNTSVAYGAEFDGRWYAVAIWSQPIIRAMCDGNTIELRRLAICGESPKNTASRMLAVMRTLVKQKYPAMTRAISYLAIDVHSGSIYRASGWRPVGVVSAARPQRFSGVNKRTRATAPLQTTSRKQRYEIEL